MDNKKLIQGLSLLIEAVSEGDIEVEKTLEIPFDNNLEILANRIATAYNTFHPEYGIESLFKDITFLANNEKKFGYLVGWLRKKGYSDIDWFFKDKDKQQQFLKKAIKENESLIKEILTKRFKS